MTLTLPLGLDRSRERTAWAAGLFEGEGTFVISAERGKTKRRSLVARLKMTDEDTVRRFFSVVEMGTVRFQLSHNPNHKPLWVWQTSGASVVKLYSMFEPWLSSRRLERFAEILLERQEYELQREKLLSVRGPQRMATVRNNIAETSKEVEKLLAKLPAEDLAAMESAVKGSRVPW